MDSGQDRELVRMFALAWLATAVGFVLYIFVHAQTPHTDVEDRLRRIEDRLEHIEQK